MLTCSQHQWLSVLSTHIGSFLVSSKYHLAYLKAIKKWCTYHTRLLPNSKHMFLLVTDLLLDTRFLVNRLSTWCMTCSNLIQVLFLLSTFPRVGNLRLRYDRQVDPLNSWSALLMCSDAKYLHLLTNLVLYHFHLL